MIKKLFLSLTLTLLPFSAMAQTAAPVVPGYLSTNSCPGGNNPCWFPTNGSTAVAGTQTGVSLAAATALTVPTGANIAVITVEGTNNASGICARWRDDGTDPTASTGSPLAANAVMVYQVKSSAQAYLPIKLITATGATCSMDVAYYK